MKNINEIDEVVLLNLLEEGKTFFYSGKYEEAIKVFDAIQLNNIDWHLDDLYFEILDLVGWSFRALERYADAVEMFNKALKIKPEDAWTLFGKGLSLNELGEHEKALVSLSESLRINPESVSALNSVSYSLHKLGKHKNALAALDLALKIDPKNELTVRNQAIESREVDMLMIKDFFHIKTEENEESKRDAGTSGELQNIVSEYLTKRKK